MKVISITGGVGSGKSEVMRLLREEFGAETIEADRVTESLFQPGTPCFNRVTDALGTSFLTPEGNVDRKKLAALVFKDKEALETLNRILHPATWDEIFTRVKHCGKELAVVEAALFDDEHNAYFDEIWYIAVKPEIRIKRLMESRGYTEEKCRAIMANQASEKEYLAIAGRVIHNNDSLEELRGELKAAVEACLGNDPDGAPGLPPEGGTIS